MGILQAIALQDQSPSPQEVVRGDKKYPDTKTIHIMNNLSAGY